MKVDVAGCQKWRNCNHMLQQLAKEIYTQYSVMEMTATLASQPVCLSQYHLALELHEVSHRKIILVVQILYLLPNSKTADTKQSSSSSSQIPRYFFSSGIKRHYFFFFFLSARLSIFGGFGWSCASITYERTYVIASQLFGFDYIICSIILF